MQDSGFARRIEVRGRLRYHPDRNSTELGARKLTMQFLRPNAGQGLRVTEKGVVPNGTLCHDAFAANTATNDCWRLLRLIEALKTCAELRLLASWMLTEGPGPAKRGLFATRPTAVGGYGHA